MYHIPPFSVIVAEGYDAAGTVLWKVVKPPYVWARGAISQLSFERRYGVKTSGDISLKELGVEGADRNRYLPSGVFRLYRILPRRQVSDEDVFIDIGSGMGRVVLQAALRYPFGRVIGVELSDQLHEIAVSNVEHIRDRLRCRDVSLVQADVLDYDIPDDVSIVFLFNPFGGATFRTVIDRLIESVDRNPRSVRVIYANPVEEAALLSTGRMQQIRALRGMRPTAEWSRSNAVRMYSIDLPLPSTSPGSTSRGSRSTD